MRRATLCCLAAALLLGVSLSDGCVTNTRYGTEQVEALTGHNHSEADVIRRHGAPDNIVYLGTPYYNPATGELGAVDKYLLEYRIGGGSTFFGRLWADDSFHNICYLIYKGDVMGGGSVSGGQGSMILGAGDVYETPFGTLDLRLGGYLHPKTRAGYGGDGSP